MKIPTFNEWLNEEFDYDEDKKMLKKIGLERVFSPGNQFFDRVFYDPKEGKYYDRYSDIYLEPDELKKFGL